MGRSHRWHWRDSVIVHRELGSGGAPAQEKELENMKVPQSLRDLVESAESLVYIEDLSGKRGLLQAINPMVKLIVVVFMIVTSLFLSSLLYLTLICAVPLILVLASKIPLKQFASRTAFIPAFAAIIS